MHCKSIQKEACTVTLSEHLKCKRSFDEGHMTYNNRRNIFIDLGCFGFKHNLSRLA